MLFRKKKNLFRPSHLWVWNGYGSMGLKVIHIVWLVIGSGEWEWGYPKVWVSSYMMCVGGFLISFHYHSTLYQYPYPLWFIPTNQTGPQFIPAFHTSLSVKADWIIKSRKGGLFPNTFPVLYLQKSFLHLHNVSSLITMTWVLVCYHNPSTKTMIWAISISLPTTPQLNYLHHLLI